MIFFIFIVKFVLFFLRVGEIFIIIFVIIDFFILWNEKEWVCIIIYNINFNLELLVYLFF